MVEGFFFWSPTDPFIGRGLSNVMRLGDNTEFLTLNADGKDQQN